MLKILNWLTKPPFYRLLLIAVGLFIVITQAEGKAFWIAGIATIIYLFLILYAYFIKEDR